MAWQRWSRAVVVVLAATALALPGLAACGGGDDDSDASGGTDPPGGGAEAGSSGGDGGGGSGGEGGSVPTAGPGQAGVFTGPTGAENPPTFEIPGCGDISAPTRLDAGEYEELLAELQCIFDNESEMPPGAVESAREAEAIARGLLAGSQGSTDPETGADETDTDPDAETDTETEVETETDTGAESPSG
jgi:hypothetical protein